MEIMEVPKTRIIGSGVFTGIVNALAGSILFMLIMILMLGFPINHRTMSGLLFQGLIPGVFICFMFSVLPGAIGGAFLSLILSNGVYSLKRVWIIGLVIGALAGLIIDFVGIYYFRASIDDFIIRLAAIALIVASIMGGFGSQTLAKKFNRLG
jgi:hypothetical protein